MSQKESFEKQASAENFESMFQQTDASRKLLEPGQKIEAVVVGVHEGYVFLDVGYKSEGYIARKELEDDEGNLTVREGDRITVYFLSADNNEKLFTRKVGTGSTSAAHLEAAFQNGIPVEGVIEKEIKGGFEVKISNARAFCPFSQIGLRRLEEGTDLIGNRYVFKIMEFSENGRNIIVSHRKILEDERQQQKEALRASVQEQMTIKGRVTSIRDFGAFVDIGGVDGLIPISEIGWAHIDNIHDYIVVDQEVEVLVLKLDWENERITLSLKQTLSDPWETIEEKFPSGSCHTGTIARLTKFGAFVTLAPGIDGLVHISKLGGGRQINHPREVVEEKQTVEVKVETIDKENKRISLALATGGQENEEDDQESTDYQPYLKKGRESGKALGSLGDILKTKMAEKNKSK